jgi:hypothetical protein
LVPLAAPQVDEAMSAGLVQSLAAAGYLGSDSKLAVDPRQSAWRDVVATVPGVGDIPLASDKSSLSEELNVAFAVHELFHDGVDQMLDFFILQQQKQQQQGLAGERTR